MPSKGAASSRSTSAGSAYRLRTESKPYSASYRTPDPWLRSLRSRSWLASSHAISVGQLSPPPRRPGNGSASPGSIPPCLVSTWPLGSASRSTPLSVSRDRNRHRVFAPRRRTGVRRRDLLRKPALVGGGGCAQCQRASVPGRDLDLGCSTAPRVVQRLSEASCSAESRRHSAPDASALLRSPMSASGCPPDHTHHDKRGHPAPPIASRTLRRI